MKAIQIKKYGHNEVVEVNVDAPKPVLSAGKVIVEVCAAGLNPVDYKIREGFLDAVAPIRFPKTIGLDLSGVILEAASDVSNFKVGDEVFGQADFFSGGGSLAEFTTAKAVSLVKKPARLTHEEAASLPLASVSAYQALVEHANLQSGQKILIHGGAGGIGSMAIAITKHLGAYVSTTASSKDLEFVKELGADEVIDYDTQSFDELLSNYDVVCDTVGGETYKKSFKVLKKGGLIVSMVEQPDEKLMEQYSVKSIAQSTGVNSVRLHEIAKLVDQGVIKPHVDKVFQLDDAKEALEYLQNGHPRGKVVVKVR